MDLSTLMPQQRQIVTTLDRPLFVSAGAGSGKTFTLTRRILWALSPESGPFIDHLDQVLAITFTKDAAAEIRERVRAALIAEGMEDEALSVDDAWISTIHGMCGRILRAHALELGLDPEFGILEDTDELISQAVDRVIARAESGEVPGGADALSALLAWYPLKGEAGPSGHEAGTSAQGLVRRLLELSCSLPGGMDDVHLVRGTQDLSALADAYRALLGASPKATQVAQEALCAIEAYEDGPQTPQALLACMMSCNFPRASKAAPKEQIDLLRAEAADTFINAYLAVSSPALDALVGLARAVEEEYRARKRELSVLDNNDLLRLAREALSDHPAIREAYAHRFGLVMIDEFQDTDQQQVDLIGYLTDNGRLLCTVGDAQQSIYRFRGAEVEVFRRQERAIQEAADAASPSAAPSNADADESTAISFQSAAPTQAGAQGSAAPTPGGQIVRLVKNFRSHAEILEYVARVFDGEQGGLMNGFLDLVPHDERKDSLVADASRRSALLVAGGTSEERARAKAAAVAKRFRALADAGQPVGDMVLLLGVMTFSGIYAEAMRAEGLGCVIAGGSVFSSTPEVQAVRALACTLADPADTAQGLVPLLSSSMFALGAEEFLALCTTYDPQTGETRRRNADAGIFTDEDAPGLDGLPLLARARQVLRSALARVGRDPVSRIARDVVRASGWLHRLAARGPEGRAVAANVLKALDILDESEVKVGTSPRRVADAFDAALAGKQAPGAINEQGGAAVRIMTVHASKGLEFPVVAVAECFTTKSSTDRMQVRRHARSVDAVALPARFPQVTLADGRAFPYTKVAERFGNLYKKWLTAGAVDDVCATGSAAEAFLSMKMEDEQRELEEKARLLYVAMTRARELLILVMDGKVGTGRNPELTFNDEHDLTRFVLDQILPQGASRLDVDRLVFQNSRSGDFELIALRDFSYAGDLYTATEPEQEDAPEGALEGAAQDLAEAEEDESLLDTFTLVYPDEVRYTLEAASRPKRASYSYSSMAAALHADSEDRTDAPAAAPEDAADAAGAAQVPAEASPTLPVEAAPVMPAVYEVRSLSGAGGQEPEAEAETDAPPSAPGAPTAPPADPAVSLEDIASAASSAAGHAADGDPTALGSAFHAAAQWLIETGSDTVPASRIDALCRTWGVTVPQRARLERALARWEESAVRRELLSWADVRAEVPFFSQAPDDPDTRERFGSYVEGAIDALATDPARPGEALVIDYKTGGSPAETAEELQNKHALQAQVYADVLHRAGYTRVTLKFVRVEIDDPAASLTPQAPGEPQTVTYML